MENESPPESQEPEREYREPDVIAPPAVTRPCECAGVCRHPSVPASGRTVANIRRQNRTIT